MSTATLPQVAVKNLAIDAAVLTMVFFIPALSHRLPFPLHWIEPMRLLLFTGFLVSRSNLNSYFLAVTIPLVSTIISGHPPAAKSLLISAELLVNVWLVVVLMNKLAWKFSLAFLVAGLASKLFYYGLKFAFLKAGWIAGSLISTPLSIQVVAIVSWSILFALTERYLSRSSLATDH